MNHPMHDFNKTLGAFLLLRVGGVVGADGERARGEVCVPPSSGSWGKERSEQSGRALFS